jgi:hypothetical protein
VVVGDAQEDGRLDVEAVGAVRDAAAGGDGDARLARELQVRADGLVLLSRGERPDVRRGVGRVADPQGLDALDKPSAEILRATLFGAGILAIGALIYFFTH